MPSVNEELVDELLRHQVYVERFKKGRLTELSVFLATLMDDVSALLGQRLTDVRTANTVNTQRLQQLLRDMQRVSDQAAAEITGTMRQQLKDLALYETGYLATAVATIVPVAISFQAVAPVQLWAAVNARPFEGRLIEEWFTDYTAIQRDRLTQAVRMSVVEGETVDQTIRRIRGTKTMGHKDGIVQGITRRSAEALARTAISHVVTAARQTTLAENQDVVKGVLWRSTLDSRTSEICITRDGKVYPVESGPRPPAHPNCRSAISPVLKSWKELGINLKEAPEGTRASMNGQVPASETYASWLKRQPVSFQNDVLGQTKAKLFRQGELTVDKFVDEQTGRGYTLAELRARHPDEFKRAGV